MQQVTLQQPPGQMFSAVHLYSGKVVKPDSLGRIYVNDGADASSLVAVGWTVIRPLPAARSA
jgi:hypothetical protein